MDINVTRKSTKKKLARVAANRKAARSLKRLKAARQSWYCDQCAVEVRQLRCPHCGKTRFERA